MMHNTNRLAKGLRRLRHSDSHGHVKELQLSSTDSESHSVEGEETAEDELGTVALGSSDLESGASAPVDGWKGGPHTPAYANGAAAMGAGGRDVEKEDDDNAPFTYAELQERTQAARRAVNVLLPDRTDGMAGCDGVDGSGWRAGRQRCESGARPE